MSSLQYNSIALSAGSKELARFATSHIHDAELDEIYKLIKDAIQSPDVIQPGDFISLYITNNHYSNAFKILLYLSEKYRRLFTYNTASNDRLQLFKELVRVKESLLIKILKQEQAHNPALIEDTNSNEDIQPLPEVSNAISKVYELSLNPAPSGDELNLWINNFNSFSSKYTHSQFVQLAYEIIHNRGAKGREITPREIRLNAGMTRQKLLKEILAQARKQAHLEASKSKINNNQSCKILGSAMPLNTDIWNNRKQLIDINKPVDLNERFRNRFHIKSKPGYLVSAITSLYKGGNFIDAFMDNITSQTCFSDYCELIIIDADSPDNESKTIKKYLSKYKNINYIRVGTRIGIYDAWNIGIEQAQGKYITNTNVDDIRRKNSIELQCATLENLPFVDVVYQDLYYTLDPKLTFEQIKMYDFRTLLPPITPYNLMEFNSPGCAPMWRKKLHEDLGMFDISFNAAGDYEFWMRCIAADKVFYKINDPHSAYYQNPEGLSTRPDGHGRKEINKIHKKYGRILVSNNVITSYDDFKKRISGNLPVDYTAGNSTRYILSQSSLRNLARMLKYKKAIHDD